MSKLETLRAKADKLNAEVRELQSAQRDAENTAMVGRCFKYRNTCSLPEKDSDYWWLYLVVTAAKDGALEGITFERDKHGNVRVNRDACLIALSSGYREIERSEFDAAWATLLDHVYGIGKATRGHD